MRIRRIAQDLALGLLVSVVLFGLLELALWGLGLGDATGTTDLSRGFDSSASYLVPDPELPGGWTTRYYNGTNREHRVPPKGDAKRVILFGGSNTRGFQHGKAQQAFDALAPGEFEVINLGRSGYGSARVAIIFEQALERLDPDVMVIYMGHNEFVEAGFQMDLDDEWSSETVRVAGEFMRSTRTVHLLSGLFAEQRAPVQAEPERWRWEYSKFADLHYDETLEHFADYEQRLRAMCERARARGVDVVVCSVIYNRFSAPHVSNLPPAITAENAQRFTELHESALAALTPSIQYLLPERESGRVHVKDWTRQQGELPEEIWNRELPGRRPCGGPFATQKPHLGDGKLYMRKVWDLYDHLQVFFDRTLAEGERAQLEQAERDLQAALAIVPDHPRALFSLGLVEYVLERPEEAVREHIESSHTYDRAPRKANRVVNGIIRKTAEEIEGVVLLDSDERFAQHMPMRMTGWEWMIDHCHLNIGARIIVMKMLADEVVANFR